MILWEIQDEDHCIIEIYKATNPVLSWLKPQNKSLKSWMDLVIMPKGMKNWLDSIIMLERITLEFHEDTVLVAQLPLQ